MVIKSVRRVFELFELFDERRGAVTLTDVMRRFNYPASSASELLKSMVELGYLEYDKASGTYMPTMRMTSKVGWVESALFGRSTILQAMRKIHDLCEETVSLGVQSDLYAQYIHQIPTRLPHPYPRMRQTIRPLGLYGLGWILLSAQSDEQINATVRRINYVGRPKEEWVDIDFLMEQVQKIRHDGYVYSRNRHLGAGFLGMMLPENKIDTRRFVLGVNGPLERLDDKKDMILAGLKDVIAASEILEDVTRLRGAADKSDAVDPVIP